MPSKPNDHEFHIGVLRILEHLRKTSEDQPGGASGKVLMEILQINNDSDMDYIMKLLKDNGYIETGTNKFLITESGQEYLSKNLKSGSDA